MKSIRCKAAIETIDSMAQLTSSSLAVQLPCGCDFLCCHKAVQSIFTCELSLRWCHTRSSYHAWQHAVCSWPDDLNRCADSCAGTCTNILQTAQNSHPQTSLSHRESMVLFVPNVRMCLRLQILKNHITIPNCHVQGYSSSCREARRNSECAISIASRQGFLVTMQLWLFHELKGWPSDHCRSVNVVVSLLHLLGSSQQGGKHTHHFWPMKSKQPKIIDVGRAIQQHVCNGMKRASVLFPTLLCCACVSKRDERVSF